jgi:GNAT superfamily N-acetyltransferase
LCDRQYATRASLGIIRTRTGPVAFPPLSDRRQAGPAAGQADPTARQAGPASRPTGGHAGSNREHANKAGVPAFSPAGTGGQDGPVTDDTRISIRERRADDLDAVVSALARITASDGYPGYPPRDPAAWLSRPDVLRSWVAERDGDLVGHVSLRHSPDHRAIELWCEATGRDPAGCVVLARLFVVPAARGTGLGRRLVAVACAEAERLGRHPVLDVAHDGHAAIRLYERLGWVRLGSYEQPHRYRPTEFLHCYAAPRR